MSFIGKTLGVAAFLLPALAMAQPTTTTTTTVDPVPQPPPATTTTTVQTAPQQAPPVVVVPQQPQPQVVVVPPQPAPPLVPTTIIETNTDDADVIRDPVNTPVFTTGAIVFGGTYLTSVIVAGSSSEHVGHHHLYVPLAGPWLDLADRPSCDASLTRCDRETTTKVLLIADGIFQAAGVLAMIDGVLDPGSHRGHRNYADNKKVHVVPTTFAGTGGGLNVFGKF